MVFIYELPFSLILYKVKELFCVIRFFLCRLIAYICDLLIFFQVELAACFKPVITIFSGVFSECPLPHIYKRFFHPPSQILPFDRLHPSLIYYAPSGLFFKVIGLSRLPASHLAVATRDSRFS